MKPLAILFLAFCTAIAAFAPNAFAQGSKRVSAEGRAIDKAYLQKIWDGWATLDAAGQKQYYA
ncbi:MAG: hypothetical protein WBW53_01575 [Terriglobales bacterium]